MTKKTRRDKAARESQNRLERHNAERNASIARAHAQRKPVDGMQRVEMSSIADSLDEVDSHIRGAVIGPLTAKTIHGMTVPVPTPGSPAYGKPMHSMQAVENDVDERPGSPAAFRQLRVDTSDVEALRIVQNMRTELEDRATKPIAAPYRDKRGEFVPPRDNPFVGQKDDRTTIREEPPMQNSSDATFSSNERVKPKAGTAPGQKVRGGKAARPYMRLKLPADVVEAIGIDKLESTEFEVELTDDGILFRPAGTRPIVVPAWAKREAVSPVTGRVATTAHR